MKEVGRLVDRDELLLGVTGRVVELLRARHEERVLGRSLGLGDDDSVGGFPRVPELARVIDDDGARDGTSRFPMAVPALRRYAGREVVTPESRLGVQDQYPTRWISHVEVRDQEFLEGRLSRARPPQ